MSLPNSAYANNESRKTAVATNYTCSPGNQLIGSVPSTISTVTVKEYTTGCNITAVCTLNNFVVGALAGAGAALGVGNIFYSAPAGQHTELFYSFQNIALTCLGTGVVAQTGIGSVIASGAVSVLSGTATFQNRLTAQAITTDPTAPTAVSALVAATAGIGTGISLNVAANVKNFFLNAAGTWNSNNVGNLTASGIICIQYNLMG